MNEDLQLQLDLFANPVEYYIKGQIIHFVPETKDVPPFTSQSHILVLLLYI